MRRLLSGLGVLTHSLEGEPFPARGKRVSRGPLERPPWTTRNQEVWIIKRLFRGPSGFLSKATGLRLNFEDGRVDDGSWL